MADQDGDEIIELYVAPSQLEADRLVLLLEEDGVTAMARATTMASFPTSGSYLILVKNTDLATAKKTISDARAGGAISDAGAFTDAHAG